MRSGAFVGWCLGISDKGNVLQLDNMLNGASVLDDDDRFADLPALSMINEAGSEVALPDLTARASWELCCATLREGLSDMQPAQVSNQVRLRMLMQLNFIVVPCHGINYRMDVAPVVQGEYEITCISHFPDSYSMLDRQVSVQAVLAARDVMKQAYNGHLKVEDDLQSTSVRDVSLATQHARLGVCMPGACPLDPNSLGPMEPVLSEAQAYLQLQHIVRQLDARRVQARIPKEANASQQLMQLQTLLDPAAAASKGLLESCSYHWVNLLSVFQDLVVS